MRLETRMIVVMLVVVLGSAALLGLIFAVTSPLIAQQKEEKKQEALTMLLPRAQRFHPDTVISENDTSVVYHAYKEGEKIGIVFTVAPKGYSGPIETMVGLRSDTTISGIRVASAAEGMSETPGLGARVTEAEFRNQFNGLKPEEIYLEKEDGKVEAITAATISSKAVTSGVRRGVERYACFLTRTSEETSRDTVSTAGEESSQSGQELTRKKVSAEGYAGKFTVIVFLDSEGKIARLQIPEQGFSETFGIGTKCREEEFLSRFLGLSSSEEVREVQAVSGATVTSKAVKDAVARALRP